MTIRLNYEGRPGKIKAEFSRAGDDVYNLYSDSAASTVLATCDSLEEAEQAKRAFEQVLAPRFTRDEAIAIVMANQRCADVVPYNQAARLVLRAALEALAAAGVFSDSRCAECRDDHRVMTCESCGKQTMTDKLDAAGIR